MLGLKISKRIPVVLLAMVAGLSACQSSRIEPTPHPIEGHFEDDYGIQYRITSTEWTQFPSSIYHIVEWNDEEHYVLAQNDSLNSSGANLWTRIDWMTLENMAPFEWAFCLSAYEAESLEAARNSPSADRTIPKTGCAGYPFSRLKPSDGQHPEAGSDRGY